MNTEKNNVKNWGRKKHITDHAMACDNYRVFVKDPRTGKILRDKDTDQPIFYECDCKRKFKHQRDNFRHWHEATL